MRLLLIGLDRYGVVVVGHRVHQILLHRLVVDALSQIGEKVGQRARNARHTERAARRKLVKAIVMVGLCVRIGGWGGTRRQVQLTLTARRRWIQAHLLYSNRVC